MIQIYNIRKLRKAKGWSQEVLSMVSGVHRVMIARYEAEGKGMTLVTAYKLAGALGCTVDELYNDDRPSA